MSKSKQSKGKPQMTSTAEAILAHPLGEARDLFKVDNTGIWRKVHVKDAADDKWEWICALVEVLAYARTADNEGWGKVLRFYDPDGVEHQWIMPEEILASDKSELCGQLLRRGLRISTSK